MQPQHLTQTVGARVCVDKPLGCANQHFLCVYACALRICVLCIYVCVLRMRLTHSHPTQILLSHAPPLISTIACIDSMVDPWWGQSNTKLCMLLSNGGGRNLHDGWKEPKHCVEDMHTANATK